MVDNKLGIDRQLESFRAARRDIEASVLPLATSVDGRRFTFQASLYSLQLQVGSYAVLDGGGGVPRLGQVLALEMDQQPGAELTLPPGAEGCPGGPDRGPFPVRTRRRRRHRRRSRPVP
jgi:hypothetical protein